MKVLIIQLKGIGDVLLSTTAIENIKRNYKDAEIDYVVYKQSKPLLENNPNIRNIIVFENDDKARPFNFIKSLLKLRENEYDYVIDFIGKPVSGIMALFSRSKKRVALKKNKFRNKILYNTYVTHKKGAVSTLEKRNSYLAAISDNLEIINEFNVYLLEDEKKEMKKRMENAGIDFSKPIFAFAVNAVRYFKIWPKEHFIKVIDYFMEKYGVQVILHNSPAERDYAFDLQSKLKNKKMCFPNVETKNIRDLALLFSNCDIFIGNEGGPRHIAEAVGKPTFTIFDLDVSKHVWIPNEGSFHRVVSLQDYNKMSDEEFSKYRRSFSSRDEKFEAFTKLPPEFVISEFEKFILNLNKNGDLNL